jgi:hypothetical protein
MRGWRDIVQSAAAALLVVALTSILAFGVTYISDRGEFQRAAADVKVLREDVVIMGKDIAAIRATLEAQSAIAEAR